MTATTYRRWAALLAAGCLLVPSALKAQGTEPAQPAPPSQPATPEVRTADLQILAKAFGDLLRQTALEAQSETTMSGTGQGFSFTARQQHKITVKTPYRFRAEIAMVKEDGTPGARYLSVSDGGKVITYRPGTRQYASVTRAKFEDDGDEVSVLGLFGALYFNRDLLQGISAITAETREAFLQELKKENTSLSGAMDTVDGKEYAAFTLFMEKDNVTLRFWVDPQTSSVDQLEMKVKEKNMDVTMTEKVQRRTPVTTVAAGTFTFTPPKGVKKVNKLSVEPF